MTALPLFLLILLGIGLFVGLLAYLPVLWGAPWTPTSRRVRASMLRLAAIRPGERVVIAAAQSCQAQAVGVEIDPLRCLLSNALIRCRGLQGRARVVWGNLHHFDLRDADVVLLYLLQRTNARLWARLARELKPGARVISYTFTLPHWTPAIIDDTHGILVYHVVPEGAPVQTQFV